MLLFNLLTLYFAYHKVAMVTKQTKKKPNKILQKTKHTQETFNIF